MKYIIEGLNNDEVDERVGLKEEKNPRKPKKKIKIKKRSLYFLIAIAWILFSAYLIKGQMPVFAYTSMYELHCDDGKIVGPQIGNSPTVYAFNKNDFLKKGPYFYGSKFEHEYYYDVYSVNLNYGDKIARFVCTPEVDYSIQDILDLNLDNQEFEDLVLSYGSDISIRNYEIIITEYKQFQSWKGYLYTLRAIAGIPLLIFFGVIGVIELIKYIRRKKGINSDFKVGASDIVFWVVSSIIIFYTLFSLFLDIRSNIWRFDIFTSVSHSEEKINQDILGRWYLDSNDLHFPVEYIFFENGDFNSNAWSRDGDSNPELSQPIDGESWKVSSNIITITQKEHGLIDDYSYTESSNFEIYHFDENKMILISGNRWTGYKRTFNKVN